MDADTYIKIHNLIEEKREQMIKGLVEFVNIPGASDWSVREKAFVFLTNIEKLDNYLDILKKVFDGQ